MKKLFTLILIFSFMFTKAQLVTRDFMDDIILGDPIEKGDYSKDGTAIQPNQWSCSQQFTGGSSPIAVSPLIYDDYVESGETNAIKLEKLATGSRCTPYSLVNSKTSLYSSGSFYLAFMIKVDEITVKNNGVAMLIFDGSHVANFRKTSLYLRDVDDTSFKFGIGQKDAEHSSADGNVQLTSSTYNYNETYLVVMKHDFDKTPEEYSLFVNPVLEETEPLPTVTSPTDDKNGNGLINNGLRAITLRQRNLYSATIGGLRLAKSWSSAIDSDFASGINKIVSNVVSKEYYTLTGTQAIQPLRQAIYLEKTTFDNGEVQWEKKFINITR